MTEISRMNEAQLWDLLAEVRDAYRVDVLCELARRAIGREDFATARTLLDEAQTTAQELADLRWSGLVMSAQAALNAAIGELEDAIVLYAKAAELYWKEGDTLSVAAMLHGKARNLFDAGRFDEAVDVTQEAYAFVKEVDDRRAGQLELLRASALRRQHQDGQALAACESARAHLQAVEDVRGVADVDDLMVCVFMDLGDYEAAEALAVSLLSLDDVSPVGRAEYRLAEVLHKRGKDSKARKHIKAACSLYAESENWVGLAHCHLLRAEILAGLRRFGEVKKALGRAQKLFEAAGRDAEVLDCRVAAAFHLHNRGKYRAAARRNRLLIQEFRARPGGERPARLSAVRLLDNLVLAGDYGKCCRLADEFMDLWESGVDASDPIYREFLALWAAAHHLEGRTAHAAAMAVHVLKYQPEQEIGYARGWCPALVLRQAMARGVVPTVAEVAAAVQGLLDVGQFDEAESLLALLRPADEDSVAA